MKTITLPLLVLFFSFSGFAQSTATYNITFTSIWNAMDHTSIPDGPHWSKLVGANHNSNVTFLEMGGIATQGIEDIAERGINTSFNNEVDTSISNGNAQQYIEGGGLGSATGTITIDGIQVNEDHPLLTLVSMIAPSPDWMIAVNSLNLRNVDNTDWQSLILLDLYPYDAGTDSGVDYESDNADIVSHIPISNFFDGGLTPPFNDKKIGTLRVELESVLNTSKKDLASLKIFPNPSTGVVTLSNIQNLDLEQIEVYDILGKKVFNKDVVDTSNLLSLNLESLNSGLYLLNVRNSQGNARTQKLVLQ